MNPKHNRGSGESKPGVSPDRLSELLSRFSNLRRDGQALITQIRGSLEDMRELRGQLQAGRGERSRSRNGSELTHAAYLQLQYGLTAREMQVAMLLSQGRSNAAIASALRISTHTARHHTQRILAKLGVHSRAAAGAKIRG
jgi:DNA-binding CsgD family transcriptional regulator